MKTTFILNTLFLCFLFLSGCKQIGSCVAKGTKITTPTGFKLIEEIVPGDSVLSYDIKNKIIKVSKIKRVILGTSDKFVLLNDMISITKNHVIYDFKAEKWIRVSELNNVSLIGFYNHKMNKFSIESKTELKGRKPSYDLELDGDFKNYFANGILVHNKTYALQSCATDLGEGYCQLIGRKECLADEIDNGCADNHAVLCFLDNRTIVFDTTFVTRDSVNYNLHCN